MVDGVSVCLQSQRFSSVECLVCNSLDEKHGVVVLKRTLGF